MAVRSLLIILILTLFISCTAAVQKEAEKKPEAPKAPVLNTLPPPPPPVFKESVIEEDPLEGVFITLDSFQESISSILYMIAAESGLNLVISPDIDAAKPLTITVNDMPARDVLDIISENTEIYYEVKGSALKIASSVTKTFKIPYVRMAASRNSEIGGDVFGSAESGLKGDYTIKYESKPEESNVQAQIISAVYSILFPNKEDELTGESTKSSGASADSAGTYSERERVITDSYFRGTQGYLFNRFTGVLKVQTTPARMRMVESYLDDVLGELNKQVLIEARMVEVTLDDSNEYGIDWDSVFRGKIGGESLSGTISGVFDAGTSGFVGTLSNGSTNSVLSVIASTAKVESVGNPSIRLMNGQSAMISSGQLIPYWEMDRETDTEADTTTVTYTRVTVLDGIVMGVTAHIKSDSTITLNVVPVFSDVKSEKIQYNEAGEIVASYPVVNLKEAGTILNVKSGGTIIMGGLISKEDSEVEDKVPGLGDIPLLGYLFKHKKTVTAKTELVIFLTATVIDG